ncbi:MAG: two pore domain potassium channel family protein [Endozoicomonadaceae bacterium]|nr:two pore domain potassium channel family protein [Endozoicomonadaceae bacterium]
MFIEDYQRFVTYLRKELNENDHGEVNGFELLVDYLLDYPPSVIDDVDSDYFREEIDRFAQDIVQEIENKLVIGEKNWLNIQNGKWLLLKEGEHSKEPNLSDLYKKLNPSENSLLQESVLNLDESKIHRLKILYKDKVEKFGSSKEKYEIISLITQFYSFKKSEQIEEVEFLEYAGQVGEKLKKKASYRHFENIAKSYRAVYEHEKAATYYNKALKAAEVCNEDSQQLFYLTKNMRIQLELCSEQDAASSAFVDENKLKTKMAKKKRTKTMLWVLGFLSDYCQNPKKVAFFAIGLIFLSTIFYACAGIKPSEGLSQTIFSHNNEKSICLILYESFYFSIVTFTTLGYGDFSPANIGSKIMANIEALGGLFLTSLFLVTLVRKYGR